AHAFITVVFNSVVANGGGPGIFRWNYTAKVDPASRANEPGNGAAGPGGTGPAPGDFVTMYDFLGATGSAGITAAGPGHVAGDYLIQQQLLGATPGFNLLAQNDAHYPAVIASDDPTITNFTFRLTPPPSILGGPTLFASFFIDSTVGFGALANYSAGSHTLANNVSESAVSAVLRPTITAVPEPGTMALFGLGAVGLFLKLRRRRKTE